MTYSLHVKKRIPKDASQVRAQGRVPCVVYGPGREATSVSAPAIELEKLYSQAGESSLVDFSVEDENQSVKVLIQDVQVDPVKGNIIHVDFRQIKMDEEMTAEIEIEFVGESPAVKALGGTLVKGHDTLEIVCLPTDLVSSVEIDISVLATFDDVIHVKDIKLPAGIKLSDAGMGDVLVAKVSAPLSEAQLKAMEEGEPKSVEDIEVEKKGKEEKEGEVAGDTKEEKQ
ncbi:MAG: 50S ribosomal protein L25 [Candidatus Magasanikbacteria bacterium]|nr:50S ribosomal protein L25 [Candidatus Magasanikbacteria bacterium]